MGEPRPVKVSPSPLPLRALPFIPTYMGNANQAGGITRAKTVHPHVHGERRTSGWTRSPAHGSSPRTWGTHVPGVDLAGSLRFIPTYMGNASTRRSSWCRPSVHPYVHGERLNPAIVVVSAVGSSPRTWGTQPQEYYLSQQARFIPTYMGNAGIVADRPSRPSVHPHVHGERSTSKL